MVCLLYRFHICSWQTVNLLVNECEADGGDRILLCVIFFFFFFFFFFFCLLFFVVVVFVVIFFPTYLLCVHVHVYLHTCICVYVCMYACGQYVMCTMFICKLCHLLCSICIFFSFSYASCVWPEK